MEKQLHLPLMVSLVSGSTNKAGRAEVFNTDQNKKELSSVLSECERKRLSRELASYSKNLKW